MSTTVVTFRRAPGGWVAHGPADEVAVGALEVHKRDGTICPQVALVISEPFEESGVACRVAYLGRGCGKAHAPAPASL